MAANAPLLVKRVKLSKQPGVLTVSRQNLAWKPNDPAAASNVDLSMSAITNQQRAKGKPFLRLVTASKPYVLEFDDEADVEVVVDTLAPLLQVQRAASGQAASGRPQAPNAQADLKRSLLQNDADLQALHQQLVVQGVLSEAEFWKARAHMLASGPAAGDTQRRGLPSTMLTDVQPSADGRSDTVRVKLTPAMVHQIFAEKPGVKRAYQANVPTRMMSHADFWSKYLRHQYRQQEMRRRTAAGGSADRGYMEDEEFFARYEQEGDAAAASTSQAEGVVKPSDDMTVEDHDGMRDGYGIYHNAQKDPVQQGKAGRNRLAQDINRHAAVVMEGTPGDLPPDASDAAITLAAAAPPGGSGAGRLASGGRQLADAAERMGRSANGLDDLRAQPEQQFSELRIQDPRRAFDAAVGGAAAAEAGAAAPVSMRDVHQALLGIDPSHLEPALPDDLAMQVLQDIMRDSGGGGGTGGAAEALLPQVQGVLRQLVLTANELLRHFWGCFPLQSDQRRIKAQRITRALTEHCKRLQDMESAAIGSERSHIAQLLRPVADAIDAALSKMDASKA